MGLFVGLYNSQVCKALIPNDLRCCKKVSQARGHGFEPRLPLLIAYFLRKDFNFNTKATLIRAAFSFLCCLFLKFVFI